MDGLMRAVLLVAACLFLPWQLRAQSVFDEPDRSVFSVQRQGGDGTAWQGNQWQVAPGYSGSVMHDSNGRQMQCMSMPGGQVRCYGE